MEYKIQEEAGSKRVGTLGLSWVTEGENTGLSMLGWCGAGTLFGGAENQNLKPIGSGGQGPTGAVWMTGSGVRLSYCLSSMTLAVLLPSCVNLNLLLTVSKPQLYLQIGCINSV